MTRPLLLAALVFCTSCMKEKKTAEYKTSDLVPYFTRTVSSPNVICDAWFATKSDPNTAVTLEADAIMTCNGNLMTPAPPGYTATLTYTPGMKVQISLIRKIDGSTLTDTQVVY